MAVHTYAIWHATSTTKSSAFTTQTARTLPWSTRNAARCSSTSTDRRQPRPPATRTPTMSDPGAHRRRRDRAAQVIAAYDQGVPIPGA